jgi:hypothetical protein
LSPGTFIAGYVTDEQGTPIEAAKVEATLARNKEFASSGAVLSEANGFFSVEGLAEGTYTVRVSREEYSDEVKQGVQSGTNDLDVVLQKRGSVSGVVRDWKSHEPITKFQVRVMQRRAGGKRGYLRATRIVKKFDSEDGSYAISNLDPGDYAFTVSARGYADCTSDDVAVVRDYTIRNVDIYMNKGGELIGRVVDESRSPIKGARIVLNDNHYQDNPLSQVFSAMAGPKGASPKKRAVTESDGTFHMKLIVPGKYQVAVSHEDFNGIAVNDVVVLLGEGATAPMEDLVLLKGAGLTGRVYDASGGPVPGATIVATHSTASIRQVTTDKEGCYVFHHLTPGDYTVSCQVTRMNDQDIGNIFKQLLISEKSKVKIFLEEGRDHVADIHLIE